MDMDRLTEVKERLLRFVEQFRPLLGRSERRHWCSMYLSGLLLDGERKSIEPMAARLPGGNEQAMQQFVNQSPWDPFAVMDRLVEVMAASLSPTAGVLVLDDTTLPKKGTHSVGVARQYCGALGKVSNCQSVVSWHFAGEDFHFPLLAELYLPQEWTADHSRMAKAGVPKRRAAFVTKWNLALSLLDRIKGKIPYEAIVFDAGYGEVRQLLSALDKRKERFIGRIPESHSFWADDIETITTSRSNRGRPRKHPVVADRRHRPLTAKRWTEKLLAEGRTFETVSLPLRYKPSAEVLAVRVREVVSQAYYRPGPKRWLLIERLGEDRFKYYVSNFPEDASVPGMMVLAHRRWMIEQGYQQLKEELGLDHFEGRSWTGLHHHIALCFMAFCFLVLLGRDHQKKLQGDAARDPAVAERDPYGADLSALRQDQLPRAVGFL
jgi:SRSO17 transposase